MTPEIITHTGKVPDFTPYTAEEQHQALQHFARVYMNADCSDCDADETWQEGWREGERILDKHDGDPHQLYFEACRYESI